MPDYWKIDPPLTSEQGPTNFSLGSQLRDDFNIAEYPNEFEILTCLHWTGLSHEDVASLRRLKTSEELKKLIYSYGYGISWGMKFNMGLEVDPISAEFDLMIDSKETIPQAIMDEIVRFIIKYRVQ